MPRFRRLTTRNRHRQVDLHQVATQSDILLLQKQRFQNAKPRSLDNDNLLVDDNE